MALKKNKQSQFFCELGASVIISSEIDVRMQCPHTDEFVPQTKLDARDFVSFSFWAPLNARYFTFLIDRLPSRLSLRSRMEIELRTVTEQFDLNDCIFFKSHFPHSGGPGIKQPKGNPMDRSICYHQYVGLFIHLLCLNMYHIILNSIYSNIMQYRL